MDVPPFLALLPIIVLVVSLVFFLSTGRKTRQSHGDGRSLPPSPPGFPLLGHLPLFIGSLPHQVLRTLGRKHGPVILLRFGSVPVVVASSAAAAKEAFKLRDVAFSSRPRSPMAERLLYSDSDFAFAPYGDHWRQSRRICVLHLLSQRRILSFRRVREQETAALVDRVRGASAGGLDGAVNLSDLLVIYSSSVLMRTAFGNDFGGGVKALREVLDDFVELLGLSTIGEFVPWLGWVDSLRGMHAKARRTFEAMDSLLERGIADHKRRRAGRREGDGGDDDDDSRSTFVNVLLDVKEEGEISFDTETIKSIILSMFIGGSSTTASAIEWTMAALMNHPDEMHKLQDEIRTTIHGGGDNQVTEDHLGKLRRLKPVIKETLRLYSTAPFAPRMTTEDTELLGYHVPAGTRVLVDIATIALDPATWERAEEFLPERWLKDDDGAAVTATEQYATADFTFSPFGGGRRGCPGFSYAIASAELVVANLLYHFDWKLPPGGPSKVNMDERSGLGVGLKNHLHVVAKPWSL